MTKFKGFKYGWIDIIEKGFSFGLLDTFNPIFLKPKLWVDPSDTSTLFQDAAGTVPVASAGDPVRMILDKSRGLRRGSELVSNGDISNGVAGWESDANSVVSAEGGYARATLTSGGNPRVFQEITGLTVGDFYEISLTARTSLGYFIVRLSSSDEIGSNTPFGETSSSSSGEVHAIVKANATTLYVGAVAVGSTPGDYVEVKDVSIRKLPGNHLTAPSDAARPVYQTDGTYHWLQFDGVDDQLEAATRFGLVANPALLVVSGVRPISYDAANDRIWHIGASNKIETISGALGTDGLSWRHNNGFRKFEAIQVGSDYVLTHSRQAGDTYGDQLGFVNGAASAETGSNNPNFTPSSTEAQFYLGSRGDSEYLNMRLYSLTIMGEHTAAQQSQLERWTSRKAGVTL